ncbi:type IV secretory system conjugative DNA transfer family protein [Paenarthrobacter sp. NPDC090520]|uniref:type IV secretory system conjugative DNA transfer family protein n=1 Tax=Paenarthrobacter sp. NPDC090520 TaxID=3364382 RepID=UPI00380393CE
MAILILVLIPVAVRQRKIKPALLVAAAAVVLAGVLLFARALPLYVTPYVELVRTAVDSAMNAGGLFQPGGMGRAVQPVLDLVVANWWVWILAQLVFAVPAAALIASAIAAWRKKFDPAAWREKVEPKKLDELRKTNAAMPRWTQEAPAAGTDGKEPAKGKGLSLAAKMPFGNRADVVTSLDGLMLRLGSDKMTGKPFDLPAIAMARQSYIEGPSGFGKTRILIELMRGLIEAPAAQQFKIGMAFITMKPDPEITEAARAVAELAGRKLYIVTEDGRRDGEGQAYNPLRHGTAEQIRNRVIEAERKSADGGFSEAHYARGGSRFALIVAKAMMQLAHPVDGPPRTYMRGGKKFTWKQDYAHFAYLMNLRVLQEHSNHLDADLQWQITEYAKEAAEDKDVLKFASGMRNRLADVAEGAAGNVLMETDEGLDLRQVIEAGDMVLFNLDAMQDAQAARYVANLALQDLTSAIGELGSQVWHKENQNIRGKQNRMFWIPVDEFSALGGSLVADLYARARSNGFAVTLSTQDQAALIKAEMFEDVNTNANVKILFNQERNAEDHANNIGTAKTMIETFQMFEEKDLLGTTAHASGQGNIREGDTYVIHPNEFKQLQPGEAIILTKTPREQHRVALRMSDPIEDAKKAREAAAARTNAKPQPVEVLVPPEDPQKEPVKPAEAASVEKTEPAVSVWAAAAAAAKQDRPAASAAKAGPEKEPVAPTVPAADDAEDWEDDDWSSYVPVEEPR